MLILPIPEDFNKLLQDGNLTPITALRELGGVMVMTIHVTIMLIITVLSAENGVAEGACEVVDMVLAVQCGNI